MQRDELDEAEDAVLAVLQAANMYDTAIDLSLLSPAFRQTALEQLSCIYTACGFSPANIGSLVIAPPICCDFAAQITPALNAAES